MGGTIIPYCIASRRARLPDNSGRVGGSAGTQLPYLIDLWGPRVKPAVSQCPSAHIAQLESERFYHSEARIEANSNKMVRKIFSFYGSSHKYESNTVR